MGGEGHKEQPGGHINLSGRAGRKGGYVWAAKATVTAGWISKRHILIFCTQERGENMVGSVASQSALTLLCTSFTALIIFVFTSI